MEGFEPLALVVGASGGLAVDGDEVVPLWPRALASCWPKATASPGRARTCAQRRQRQRLLRALTPGLFTEVKRRFVAVVRGEVATFTLPDRCRRVQRRS